MRRVIAILCLSVFACAGAAPAACDLGRVVACPCPGGASGAQECGPGLVWSACVCAGTDGRPDVASDVPDATEGAVAVDRETFVVVPDVASADAVAEAQTVADVVAVDDASADRSDPCAGSCAALAGVVEAECLSANRCAIRRCAQGFADCDGLDLNGCETDTRSDRRNCGRCRAECNGVGHFCSDGTCF
jgi:hypothetical protein